MSFDPKRIERLAARAAMLEQQAADLVAELQELAQLAAAEPAPAPSAPAAPVPDPEPDPEPEPEPDPEPPAKPASAAPEAARLVALNMALSGTPREETARYLRENYDLPDDDPLLDDVYAKAGS